LDTGDMVRHPVSGHIGVIIGRERTGMWTVEWFSAKNWKLLEATICTAEYNTTLDLLRKAEEA
jgi:hypothetical protein